MNSSLFIIGMLKLFFGVIVGALGVFLASRAMQRLLTPANPDSEMRRGNLAAGILNGASLVALGLLVQNAITATFDAMDFLYRDHDFSPHMLLRFGMYAVLHVGFSLAVGACVLALGAWLFSRLTRHVDEIAEIRRGNVAPAIVLGAVLIVLALMTSPGLRTALDGLLPLPELPPGVLQAPS